VAKQPKNEDHDEVVDAPPAIVASRLITEQGIYDGVPEADYHADPCPALEDATRQRDALAAVVLDVWAVARGGQDVAAYDIECWMLNAGLIGTHVATKTNSKRLIEAGDELIGLTPLGGAALSGVPLS
jgi:hypothetical protein